MALTPRPRARSSSSLIARSWRPNRDRRTSQAIAIGAGREGERDVVEGRVVGRPGQLRNGDCRPLDPPVKLKLNAISWKMKKTAIVITMNVCRLTRSAISPNGTAMAAPTRPCRAGAGRRPWCPVDVPVARGDAHRVGAAAVEHRLAEGDVAGVAGEDVPRGRRGDEDHREHAVVGDRRVGVDLREGDRDRDERHQRADP